MGRVQRFVLVIVCLVGFLSAGGCTTTVQPGHLGLLFEPYKGGLQREPLTPGTWHHSRYARVDDFDITYSTHQEDIRTISAEGLDVEMRVSVRYRPVLTELYQLETEVGLNYYDEVIGPEFRSASKGVVARHSYKELHGKNEQEIEDEMEADLRRRCAGKHIEIASVTMEAVTYAEQISNAIRDKLVGEQEAIRRKASDEADYQREQQNFIRDKDRADARVAAEAAAKEHERQQENLAKEHEREQEKLAKKHELDIAEQQAAIDKIKAAAEAEEGIVKTRAEAEEATLMAQAHAAENRAETHTLTPLAVIDHAYEALGKLGGSGTTIMLGDFTQASKFLFPQFGPFSNPFFPAARKTVAETASTSVKPPVAPDATLEDPELNGDGEKTGTHRKTHARRNRGE